MLEPARDDEDIGRAVIERIDIKLEPVRRVCYVEIHVMREVNRNRKNRVEAINHDQYGIDVLKQLLDVPALLEDMPTQFGHSVPTRVFGRRRGRYGVYFLCTLEELLFSQVEQDISTVYSKCYVVQGKAARIR